VAEERDAELSPETRPQGDEVETHEGDNTEEFDLPRAMATIKKLRQYERQAIRLQKEVERLKREKELSGKTESERVAAQLAELERRSIALEMKAAQEAIRADFIEKAIAEGVTNSRLAYLAAQSEGLLGSYDEDTGVGPHDFATLRKKYPDLFRPQIRGTVDGKSRSTPPQVSVNEWIRMKAGRK